MNSQQLATVMQLLTNTATVAAIASATGMGRKSIYAALKALEHKRIARICRWNCDHTGRAVEPVWGLGSEPSDPRRKLTQVEKNRRYRNKLARSDRVMQAIVASAAFTQKTK